MSSAQSTALAKAEALTMQPLKQIEDLRVRFEQLRGQANVVCPVSQVDSIMPMHQLSLRVVVIDSTLTDPVNGTGPEVYRGKFCAANERALGKVAIEKIDAAAGVQLLQRRRLDDRSDPYYCEIEVTKALRDYDGMWRQTTKTKAVDLRNGSPDAASMKPSQLAQARSRIQELAESKAGLRASRTLLHLKQKYTVEDLAKAFVVPKLVPALDPNDPDQKRALIAMATGGEAQLFGPQPSEASRQLKDVTPSAPALPPPPIEKGTPPPPVGSVPAALTEDADDTESNDAAGDAGADDFDALPAEPQAPRVCTCPCSCQAELTEETVRITTERAGAPRCRACFPGRAFDLAKHRGVTSLNLPKMPDATVEKLAAQVAQARK
jgi:hypothetical protein